MLSVVITIRKATTADSAAILEVLRTAFAPYEARYTPEGYEDTVLTPDTLCERFKTMTIFVATSGEKIIGTIACSADGDEGHLRGMAVLPDHLGTDVARDLLQAARSSRIDLNTTAISSTRTNALTLGSRI